MGIIKQGILGGFSGKVGNVIGSSWRGISYMRAVAQSTAKTRSAAQSIQQERFACVVGFLQPITAYLRIGYKGLKEHESPFNAAMSYVIRRAMTDNKIDYSKVLVSHGSLMPVMEAKATESNGKVVFTWTDNSGQGDALATDLAMPLVYNTVRKEAVFSTHAATRAEGKTELNLPSRWAGDKLVIYLGVTSLDELTPANSLYLSDATATGGDGDSGSGSGDNTGGDSGSSDGGGVDDNPLG